MLPGRHMSRSFASMVSRTLVGDVIDKLQLHAAPLRHCCLYSSYSCSDRCTFNVDSDNGYHSHHTRLRSEHLPPKPLHRPSISLSRNVPMRLADDAYPFHTTPSSFALTSVLQHQRTSLSDQITSWHGRKQSHCAALVFSLRMIIALEMWRRSISGSIIGKRPACKIYQSTSYIHSPTKLLASGRPEHQKRHVLFSLLQPNSGVSPPMSITRNECRDISYNMDARTGKTTNDYAMHRCATNMMQTNS